MDQLYVDIMKLVKSGITGEPCEAVSVSDWDKVLKISRVQDLSGIIYRAIRLSKNNITPPESFLTALKLQFTNDLRTDRVQRSELSNLFRTFDEKNIDYLPLKGIVMKEYYPSPELRFMADADILIRQSQYKKIADIVKKAGYSFCEESDYEIPWRKGLALLEFHIVVFNPNHTDYSSFFEDAFSMAANIPGTNRYVFEPTDLLIYSVAHFAKHFVTGGTRLRNLTDIRYLLNEGNADLQKVNDSLEELGLADFFSIVLSAIDQWFNGQPFSLESELLFKAMMAESYDEDFDKYYTLGAAREFGGHTELSIMNRIRYYLKRLFPPLSFMSRPYHILTKLPFLLPFFWLWRIIKTSFTGKKHIEQLWNIQVKDTSNAIEQYMDIMKVLHLDQIAVPEEI
ncbi:MAG: nucleotidyltransferase family protein [Lachnospiraceae bacterium]|nr:nucleotidyltransferase family protein [Lachnospiraceae bacterium]